MAPPIKQENLPAMEDCRLLLKNAFEIKLKASSDRWRVFFASCFLGPVCPLSGGPQRLRITLALIWPNDFGTVFYVGYVDGQIRDITGTVLPNYPTSDFKEHTLRYSNAPLTP
jgi:hypothetical protein